MNKKSVALVFLLASFFATTKLFCYNITDFSAIDKQLEADVKNYHIPSMAVIVVNQSEVLFCKTYGSDATADTPFIIGSMSKSFTALAIMQLAEQGKINLNATLCTYIDCSPYFKKPEHGCEITVKQLLNHTSGLGTYQKLGNAKCNFDNYGKFIYANVNYSLLGKIIEAVSGKTYSYHIEENVLKPLQMNKTSATLKNSKADGLIDGYRNFFGFAVPGKSDYPNKKSWSQVPAGYISASIGDMGKYLQMYLNGGQGIIKSESIDKMFYDSVPENEDGKNFYGMGWTTMHGVFREPVINHSGLVENFTSNMFIFPQSKIGIAVLVNMNDYLVTNNFLENIIMPLLGGSQQKQSSQPYMIFHLLIDLVYVIILFVALLPIFLIKKWKVNLNKNPLAKRTLIADIFCHVLLPMCLLSLSCMFGVPLWVVFYYVKDLFFVLLTSAVLLFGYGVYKMVARVKLNKIK